MISPKVLTECRFDHTITSKKISTLWRSDFYWSDITGIFAPLKQIFIAVSIEDWWQQNGMQRERYEEHADYAILLV